MRNSAVRIASWNLERVGETAKRFGEYSDRCDDEGRGWPQLSQSRAVRSHLRERCPHQVGDVMALVEEIVGRVHDSSIDVWAVQAEVADEMNLEPRRPMNVVVSGEEHHE